jgi:hypothetical protein
MTLEVYRTHDKGMDGGEESPNITPNKQMAKIPENWFSSFRKIVRHEPPPGRLKRLRYNDLKVEP